MHPNHDLDAKLKILFISRDLFPPFRVDVSILFGKEFSERGHQIDWLLQSYEHCDSAYKTIWNGCRVWVGPIDNGASLLHRLRRHLYSIGHDFKMFRLVRKNQYDFIQVKGKFISALLAILASKIFKTKFIYWLSFPFPEADLYAAAKRTARYPFLYFIRGMAFEFFLYKVIMPRADHVFVQSEQMKKDIAMKGIPEKKLTPVPMGVSLMAIPYEPDKMESESGLNVLYLGTLDKVRRIDFLIKVFERVVHQIPDAKLYLVGSGPDSSDEELLKNEAIRLGIANNIIFTGFLPMQEAWRYVSKADVCVSPYYPTPILNSTSPTKLIEYMAMGKPVVANDDHPEQLSVISDSGAGICVPYQADSFADAIVTLLNDNEKAKAMGLKGRRYVEEHRTYRKIADNLEKEYLKICLFNKKLKTSDPGASIFYQKADVIKHNR